MALAVGWAGYLLPKALKRHDDLAMSRPVDTFSDSVRVVGAPKPPRADAAPEEQDEPAATVPAPAASSRRAHTVTRESARRAASRRRRVLAVLLLTLVAVGLTSYLGYTPWWSTAAPAILIVAFLVVARLTVRSQQVRPVAPAQPEVAVEAAAVPPTPADVEPDLGRDNTQGLSRDELAAAVAAPAFDDAGLWDPLPVTLPTYVNKARARRTVRTIEITGMTSSGHDAADSELARTAEEAATTTPADDLDTEAEQRRVAGA